MLDLDKQDKQSILERIKKDFPDRLAEYDSRKYPEEQYDRLLGIFREPKRVTAGDIQKALVWKYGHWGKGNYPLKHHQLITNVQRSWDQIIEQPYRNTKTAFDFWTNALGSHTSKPFVTTCFLLHLVQSDSVPIIDQHTYRAMNFFVKTVRPNWYIKRKPTQYQDLLIYREFLNSVHTFWREEGDAPSLRTLDKYLMMLGKHIKRNTCGTKGRIGEKHLARVNKHLPSGISAHNAKGRTKGNNMPAFQDVYNCLRRNGPARVVSSRRTEYTVEARLVRGTAAIIAYPRSGRVTIHEGCWGSPITCQQTRAGGIYNGPYSIYDWYADNNI